MIRVELDGLKMGDEILYVGERVDQITKEELYKLFDKQKIQEIKKEAYLTCYLGSFIDEEGKIKIIFSLHNMEYCTDLTSVEFINGTTYIRNVGIETFHYKRGIINIRNRFKYNLHTNICNYDETTISENDATEINKIFKLFKISKKIKKNEDTNKWEIVEIEG